MNILLTIDQKNFILSVIVLTLVFILLILIISENYALFSKRIKKNGFEKYYLKDISKRRVSVPDYRETKFIYGNSRNLTIDCSKPDPKAKPTNVEIDQYYLLEKKKKKLKKRTARKVFSGIFVGLCVCLLGLSVYQHFSQKLFSFGDVTYVTVVTGSMSKTHKSSEGYLKGLEKLNQIQEYDLIKLHKVKTEEDLKLFNVYAYKDKDGKLIVHRLVSKDYVDGRNRYVFKGDANPKNDTNYVDYPNILYEYKGERNHAAGLIVGFSRSYMGFISLVYVIAGLCIIDAYESKKDKLYLSELNKYLEKINKQQYKALGEYKIVRL